MKAEPKSKFVIEFDCQEVATFDHEISDADRIPFLGQDPGRLVVEVRERNRNDLGVIFLAWVRGMAEFDLIERFQESVPFIRANPRQTARLPTKQASNKSRSRRKQRVLKQLALCKRKEPRR